MIATGNIFASFLSGLLSFFAPCLLPLFPTYFSVITGFTFSELYGLDFGRIRPRVFTSSVFFTLGFALVFTLLGATGSIFGRLLETYLPPLLRFSGAFLIILGVAQVGALKFPSFRFDFAWNVQRKLTRMGYVTAVVTGIAAALSWIPCIGPLLSPILLLASQSQTVIYGASLLFIYSLGLTLPFLLAGLYFPKIAESLQRHRLAFHRLSILAGIFLIIFGTILLIDQYRSLIDWYYTLIRSFRDPFYDFFFTPPSL